MPGNISSHYQLASPSGRFPDGKRLQAGLAVFALRAEVALTRANKNIAPSFSSPRTQSSLRAPLRKFKTPGKCLGFKFMREGGRAGYDRDTAILLPRGFIFWLPNLVNDLLLRAGWPGLGVRKFRSF